MNLTGVKKGKRIQFVNDEHNHFMEVFRVMDRNMEVENGFKIRLNGELIHSYSEFQPFSRKCRDLINEFELDEN
ncbi:hypothetical protein [Maribacter litoralis]|uniref:hypothetical protein n=1 Tax=Maribacter litoralis TaxID=2059726 RepID=UPI000E30EAAF|nr:hypothetical protein [Maribacter litoralis]